jgi:serine/threonine-protein kinase
LQGESAVTDRAAGARGEIGRVRLKAILRNRRRHWSITSFMALEQAESAGSAVEAKPSAEATVLNDPFAGTVYHVVRPLGGGGMGDVFVVEHREIGRHFAAKVLRAELAKNAALVERIRVEAQALGRLTHPNIVSVIDFAKTHDGRPFFVMELLQGETLAQSLMTRGALPVAVAVACALDLLAALEATHELALVHRDVKPSNVFFAAQYDGTFRLKLIDFGTPRYVRPEGATGAHVDVRADVYGAALVLYTMLAGRGPFDHARSAEPLREAHVRERPEPPSRFARDPVPAELDALVLRALEKDPAAFRDCNGTSHAARGSCRTARSSGGMARNAIFLAPRSARARAKTAEQPE